MFVKKTNIKQVHSSVLDRVYVNVSGLVMLRPSLKLTETGGFPGPPP